MSDADAAKQALVEWASKNILHDAQLSEDGTLSLHDATFSSTMSLTVTHGEKSCQYTLASIYLQIIDPDQGLMAYRNACKKYKVSDPVKALDKPTIVGYFLGLSSSAAAAPPAESSSISAPAPPPPAEASAETTKEATAAAPSVEAAATATSTTDGSTSKSDRKNKSTSSKNKHDRHHHHSSKSSNKDRHHHRRSSEERSPKKKAKSVTNEQLFSNLNVVVDKRHMQQEASQDEIKFALSADGFMVTPAILGEYRETTRNILANEIPVGNSSSILRATNPKKDLSRVLELYNEAVKPKSSKDPKSAGASSAGGGGVAGNKLIFKRKYLLGRKPVIIVPNGMSSPITLINAHEFLCNGRFIPRDVMIQQGRQRSPLTTFTRNVKTSAGTTSLLEYEIMDNPKKLGPDAKEWERIVAVIALGQGWQFKDWIKQYSNPTTLFNETFGYFVSMEGKPIPQEVQDGWAVKKAQLSRDKRGLDSVTYAAFWNGLDEFMAVHRPELLPQPEA